MTQKFEDILFYISLIPITIIASILMIVIAVVGATTIWNIVGCIKQFLI